MRKNFRAVCEVLCLAVVIAGCGVGGDEVREATVQNIGLQASASVPSLGEGIPPVIGSGGDGSPAVTAIGGWSGGPGAVKWHGGQWVMPYEVQPGSVLQSVSCDIWNPTTSAPANVLVEVISSNGQTLGSTTLLASTSVVFRTWPFIGTHAVVDGEQLIVRVSPKDATTGAWTTGAQDTTVIGCSVNSQAAQNAPRARPTWPVVRFGASSQSEAADPVAANHPPVRRFNIGASIYAEIPFEDGETITGFSMELTGDGVVDGSLEILYGTRSGGQVQIGTLTNFTNVPATWGTFQTSTFTPTTLSGNGQLSLVLTANSPNLYWGYISPVFGRP